MSDTPVRKDGRWYLYRGNRAWCWLIRHETAVNVLLAVAAALILAALFAVLFLAARAQGTG